MRIGIIGAMEIEIEQLLANISDGKTHDISGIRFSQGKMCGHDLITAKCGVGKVSAAMCTEAMILKYEPDCIINIGVAGGVGKNLKIGDIVIADRVLQYDVDISAFGHPVGYISGLNAVHIPCSLKLTTALMEAAKQVDDIDVYQGIVATGDTFVNDNQDALKIAQQFDALAVEMEGGSIGQVCFLNQVEFAVVRAVSDTADHGSHVDFNAFMGLAAQRSYRMISELLNQL